MKIITAIPQMRRWAEETRRQGKTIGFVPTMGYLHDGHLSLMRRAKKENDCLAVSIFVNPAQFGPREDFKQYPRDFTRDKELVRSCGADVLFYPRMEEIYPQGYTTYVLVEGLSGLLCGASRPGHFRGVATIVLKLFNIVQPDKAYFGQKDAQQVVVIQRMVKDLNLPVQIKALPIVREPDGLAMSSRNAYLDSRQRTDAIILYNALQTAVAMIQSGCACPRKVLTRMREMIASKASARIDYVKIVDAENLVEVNKITGKILIAVAVFFGKCRLIDNEIIHI